MIRIDRSLSRRHSALDAPLCKRDLVQAIDAQLGSAFPLPARWRTGIKGSYRQLFNRWNESTRVSIGHGSVVFRFVLSSEPKFIASAVRPSGLLPKLIGPLADKFINSAHFRLLPKPRTQYSAWSRRRLAL